MQLDLFLVIVQSYVGQLEKGTWEWT